MERLYKSNSIDRNSCTREQLYFWKQLDKAVEENGCPFWFEAHKQSAHINQNYQPHAGGGYGIILEYLTSKKLLRVCVYIADSTTSIVWDNLLANKKHIETELELPLKYLPTWKCGDRQPNTKRIQTELSWSPYSSLEGSTADLIDEALPIIMRYIEVFPKYMPDLFN